MKKILVVFLGLIMTISLASFVACSITTEEYSVFTVMVDGVEQKVVYGERAVEPKLSREGYSLQWVCDGQIYDFSSPVTKNLVVTSTWLENARSEQGLSEIELSVFSDSEAKSVWKVQYLLDGVRFDVEISDPNVKTANSSIGMNDNIELVVQTISTLKYDTRYTFNFLIDASGKFYFRRASGISAFGTSCAYDLFVTEGENLIFSTTKTDKGWKASVFFAYELLNSDYRSAFGNVRFCPAMRNTDTYTTTFATYQNYGCTWGRPNTFIIVDKNNLMTTASYTPSDVNEAFENSDLYDGEKLTDNLALLSGGEGGSLISEFKVGCNLFSDRYYGLNESAVCDDLIGKSYLYDSIEGSYGVVQKAGYVILLVPSYNYSSLKFEIERDGFVKIISNDINLANLAVGGSLEETIDYYVKWCDTGEIISYSKYCIVVFDSVESPYVYEALTTPAQFLTDFTGYELLGRHWQGVTTIERTSNGRIYASWVSGGNGEPRGANYNVVVYSDDEGRTWNDLWIITHSSSKVKINDAQLWIDPDGVLWIFYVQSLFTENLNIYTGGASFDNYSGVWAVKVENPDGDDFVHTEPIRLFYGLLRNNPLVLSDGTWLAFPNNYVNDLYTVVFASTDKGETWTLRGQAYIPQATDFDETIVFEQNDGSLRMMVRNSGGTILQSYSYDKGYTWSEVSDSGLLNPCSRFQMVRLSSGNVMLIYNQNSSSRDDMTVCLSFDDGKTWNYKMTLDTRTSTTYPDYAIDEKTGKIYVIWDQGRLVNGNVCMAIFTEEDIMNRSEYGQENIIVISACPYFNNGLTEGDNLGSLSNNEATGGFDLTNDNGENANAIQLGEGIQKVWVKDFSGSSVLFETQIKIWSILNRDEYPKAGLVLSGENKDIFFYIDASKWLQNHTVGFVTGTNDVWDWGNEVTTPASINYSEEFVTLAVLKDENRFSFYVNGYCVMSVDDINGLGKSDEVVAGFMTFNLRAEFKNYFVSDSTEIIAKKEAENKVADILFIGDSYTSLYRWKSFFDTVNAVNVSVDGVGVSYWINNFDKIVMPYSPKKIVICVGTNDINSNMSANELYSKYETLLGIINTKLADTKVIILSIIPSVAYWERSNEVVNANQMLSEYAENNSLVTFVDVASELFTSDKSYVKSLLYADRTYFNSDGYELFNRIIITALNLGEEEV